MNIFINECSFREQFYDRRDFQAALTRFLRLIDQARSVLARRGGRMWRSELLGEARALRGETLHQTIHHVGRELEESFTDIVYNRANPAPWEPERAHRSEDRYVCTIELTKEQGGECTGEEGECVTDTSMAELAERRLRDASIPGCLLNLEGSVLHHRTSVEVVKVNEAPVALDSFGVEGELAQWLTPFAEPPPYPPEATDPPRDEQTCLVDHATYQPTAQLVHGRRVYRHKTRGHLLYVDNLHAGARAHLEVFDKRGRHLGEASLAGQLDTRKKEEGRRIKV